MKIPAPLRSHSETSLSLIWRFLSDIGEHAQWRWHAERWRAYSGKFPPSRSIFRPIFYENWVSQKRHAARRHFVKLHSGILPQLTGSASRSLRPGPRPLRMLSRFPGAYSGKFPNALSKSTPKTVVYWSWQYAMKIPAPLQVHSKVNKQWMNNPDILPFPTRSGEHWNITIDPLHTTVTVAHTTNMKSMVLFSIGLHFHRPSL
jgi:hypothetical protein